MTPALTARADDRGAARPRSATPRPAAAATEPRAGSPSKARRPRHSGTRKRAGAARGAGSQLEPAFAPCFAEIYETHFGFVWRTARRLGVDDESLDDVVQEIFVIVHRQLPGFEGRSSMRTWLFGITRHVARDYRRAQGRRRPHEPLRDSWVGAPPESQPAERVAQAEAARLLHALLDELDDDKREVFVLAELEQMTAPEIAEALGVKLNTVYSRLRAARRAFDGAVRRHRARERRRR